MCWTRNSTSNFPAFAAWGQLFQRGKHSRCIWTYRANAEDVWRTVGKQQQLAWFFSPRFGTSKCDDGSNLLLEREHESTSLEFCHVITVPNPQEFTPNENLSPSPVNVGSKRKPRHTVCFVSILHASFPGADCLSASRCNLKPIWHSWRRALFFPALRR